MKKINLFLLLILPLYHLTIKSSFVNQSISTEKFDIRALQENDKNYLEIYDKHKNNLILKIEEPGKAIVLRYIPNLYDDNDDNNNTILYTNEYDSDYLMSFIEEKSNNVLKNFIFKKATEQDKKNHDLTESCSLIEKNFSIKALNDHHVRLYNTNNKLVDEALIPTNGPIFNLKVGETTTSNETIVYYSTTNSNVGYIIISNNDTDLSIPRFNYLVNSQDNEDKVFYAKFDNKKESPHLLTLSSTPNKNQFLVRIINLMSENTTQGIINKDINLEEHLKKGFVITQANEEEINLTYEDNTTKKITLSEYINNSPTELSVDNLMIRISDNNKIELYKNKKYKQTWEINHIKIPIVKLLLCKNFDHEGNEKKDTIAFETLDCSVGEIKIDYFGTKPYLRRLNYPINK